MSLYQHVPHPHIQERTGPTKTAHYWAQLGGLNAKIGLKITVVVGTMWAAYLFTVLALLSLPSAFKTHQLIIIVAWIAQTFLQLVLLPIIIVGQNVQAAASDARADATYKDAEAVLHEALEIQKHLQAQDKILEQMIKAGDGGRG